MVLGLCALFISPTLVALSLTDILILHAFNAKKLFIKRQLMFIRGNTLRLQHVYVAHALCIGLLALCNMLGLRLHRLSFRYVWLNYSMVEGLLWHESFKGCKNVTESRNTSIAQNVIQNYYPQYNFISFYSVWLNCSEWVRALNGSALSRERLYKKFRESRIQSET